MLCANAQVAQFLRVNPDKGLFYFDASYRPVPLSQQYIGVSEPNFVLRNQLMNDVCYNKVCLDLLFSAFSSLVSTECCCFVIKRLCKESEGGLVKQFWL